MVVLGVGRGCSLSVRCGRCRLSCARWVLVEDVRGWSCPVGAGGVLVGAGGCWLVAGRRRSLAPSAGTTGSRPTQPHVAGAKPHGTWTDRRPEASAGVQSSDSLAVCSRCWSVLFVGRGSSWFGGC